MADMQNDRMDRRSYGRYEQREQCQNYRKLPRNTIDRCNETEIIADTIAEEKILSSYTILFDFDKSDIRAAFRCVWVLFRPSRPLFCLSYWPKTRILQSLFT